MRRSRHRSVGLIVQYFRKIFDRIKGRFYYAWNGPSTVVPRASWQRPVILRNRGYPKDITCIYTKDVAANVIQNKWRAVLIRRFIRAVVRVVYKESWDPVDGTFKYLNTNTGILQTEKPKLLGSELWRPNEVVQWSHERVLIFLRRLGLKQYVKNFIDYEVDGRALVLLDDEDYDNMAIDNKIHRKKIRLEVERIFTLKNAAAMARDHEIRRERIRKQKLFSSSALKLQVGPWSMY